MLELAEERGLLSKVKWMLEILDMYKDWKLLFAFPHATWAFLILSFSIVFPFAFADMIESEMCDNTLAHSFLIHIGLIDYNLLND